VTGGAQVLALVLVATADTTSPAQPAALADGATQSQEPISSGWSVYLEQDSVFSPKTDKDYTMGVQFSWSGWRIRRSPLGTILGGPQRGIDWLLHPIAKMHSRACEPGSTKPEIAPLCKLEGEQGGYQAHTLAFGVTAFTPRKGDPAEEGPDCLAYGCILASTEPVYDDRPYASLAFLTYRRSTARGKFGVHSDFTFGLLGLQIAKVVQTAIHDDQTDPGGWRHQISNAFEPTANYSFRLKYLGAAGRIHPGPTPDWAGASPTDPEDDRWTDLTFDLGGSLGFYTNASGGARLRLGLIDSPYWTTDRQPVVFTRRAERRKLPWIREAYAWASGGYTYWCYNALLQGQFRDSRVTLKFHPAPDDPNVASPLNHGAWDYQLGAILRFRPFAVSYQYTSYDALFQGPHSRRHAYWGIYLTVGNPDLAR